MKNALSSIAIIVLLVALGALTVIALPRGMETATASAPATEPAAPSIEAAASAPEAPAATNKWNSIALPLDVAGSDVSMASDVANYIASGDANDPGNQTVKRVMKWNEASQRWVEYFPQDPDLGDPDFAVGSGVAGGALALMVLVDSNLSNTVLSWVGDVPAEGTVTNPLQANGFSFIMVPLDQYASFGSPGSPSGTAADLADAITNLTRVMKWDSSLQRWVEYFPQDPDLGDPDFDVFAGYPYMVRGNASTPSQWP